LYGLVSLDNKKIKMGFIIIILIVLSIYGYYTSRKNQNATIKTLSIMGLILGILLFIVLAVFYTILFA